MELQSISQRSVLAILTGAFLGAAGERVVHRAGCGFQRKIRRARDARMTQITDASKRSRSARLGCEGLQVRAARNRVEVTSWPPRRFVIEEGIEETYCSHVSTDWRFRRGKRSPVSWDAGCEYRRLPAIPASNAGRMGRGNPEGAAQEALRR